VVVRAPAKLNLTLAVGAKRADGYHEVDSVLLALTLVDRLTACLRAEPGVDLRVSGPAAAGVPADGTNLVVRAAEGVLAAAGAGVGLALELEKHVPAGGGLGGGSADAAAAVLAGVRLLGLEPDEPRWLALLATLGSDCPFFLAARHTGLARCRGRGEQVEPWSGVRLPGWWVLVTPSFGCATARVYQAYRARPAPAPTLSPAALAGATCATLEAALRNDLLPAARASHPELEAFETWLTGTWPGRFHLSGSGSSWFALCATRSAAEALAAALRADAERRDCALRGPWVCRAAGHGVQLES